MSLTTHPHVPRVVSFAQSPRVARLVCSVSSAGVTFDELFARVPLGVARLSSLVERATRFGLICREAVGPDEDPVRLFVLTERGTVVRRAAERAGVTSEEAADTAEWDAAVCEFRLRVSEASRRLASASATSFGASV